MIRRDLEYVYAIERQCFEHPWTEDEFIRCLRQRNCIGMVAERDVSMSVGGEGEHVYDTQPVGYMIYELHKNRLHLLNFAVHPRFQRTGVGRAMIDKLMTKLSPDRRNRIVLEVRETNLDAQLFFKAMGFRAISVLRGFYGEDTAEDAYLMQRRCEQTAETV